MLVHGELAGDRQTVHLAAQCVLTLVGHVERGDQMLEAVIYSVLGGGVRYRTRLIFHVVRPGELVVLELDIPHIPRRLLIL